jgi:hypothetical protein
MVLSKPQRLVSIFSSSRMVKSSWPAETTKFLFLVLVVLHLRGGDAYEQDVWNAHTVRNQNAANVLVKFT